MNIQSPKKILPLFSLIAGIAGMALQAHLFSLINDRGLLPEIHFAAIASYLLLAAVLVVGFLTVRKISCAPVFPASPVAAVGMLVWAVGIALSSFQLQGSGILFLLVRVFGIVAAVALVLVAFLRFKGLQPNVLLYGMVILFLILRTLASCQFWIRESQALVFIFPLLAQLFLMVTCYYRAAATMDATDCRKYIFTSQAVLFCCLSAAPAGNWLFFLSAGAWLATDFCVLPVPQEEV